MVGEMKPKPAQGGARGAQWRGGGGAGGGGTGAGPGSARQSADWVRSPHLVQIRQAARVLGQVVVNNAQLVARRHGPEAHQVHLDGQTDSGIEHRIRALLRRAMPAQTQALRAPSGGKCGVRENSTPWGNAPRRGR